MKVVIVGAGTFGTALGNVLVKNHNLNIHLLARKQGIVEAINKFNINSQYFPNFQLDSTLHASTNKGILQQAKVIFLAIPSAHVVDYVSENRQYFSSDTILVVLSKGFGKNNRTIVESLKEIIHNPICSLKGPTFATDLIHNNPSAFTVASDNSELFNVFKIIFIKTNIYLDFSTDILGVELTSALKNIYAILMGIIDAYFNSANVRFLILTKAFNEMKNIVISLGGSTDTLYKYCGFGDFGLTSLNDLSRNRTLGLLIGKGFLNNETHNSVILEGKRTIEIIKKALNTNNSKTNTFYILEELHKLLHSNYGVQDFINNLFDLIRES